MVEVKSALAPIPRYIQLTPAHERKIDILLEKIKCDLTPPMPLMKLWAEYNQSDPDAPTLKNADRVCAYSYLHSRNWDVEKAFAMAKDVHNFRIKNHLDEIPLFPPAFSLRGWDHEVLRNFFKQPQRPQPLRVDRVCAGVYSHFSSGIHFWDKCGLPVLYLMIGSMDVRGLVKRLNEMANVGETTSDVLWEYMQHLSGVGELLLIYQQYLWDMEKLHQSGVDASEGLIRSITIVVDAKGFEYSMLYKPALDLFENLVTKMFQFYPNCVHRILVVNCPKIILLAYNIVKGVFDKKFLEKISLTYPKDSLAALEHVIDRRYIPQFLGGECHCEEGCIMGYDPMNPKSRASKAWGDDEDGVTENITLYAGKVHEKTFLLKSGESVVWEFAMKSGKGVLFSTYFIPSPEFERINGGKKHSGKDDFFMHHGEKKLEGYLIAKDSPTQGGDSYMANKDGVLLLIWDNRKSWFSSKKIQMKVYKYSGRESSMGSSFLQHSLGSSIALH